MINGSVTFILGAGVSSIYGYPTGEKLRENLIKDLTNFLGNRYESTRDGIFNSFLSNFSKSGLKGFLKAFTGTDYRSIDHFLEYYSVEFGEIGKYLIALELLIDETQSKLIDIKNSVYEYIFNQLIGKPGELRGSNLNFVTFNYDLSLEQYIYQKLMLGFKLDEKQVIELMQFVNIVHLHGHIGTLIFQSDGSRAYGNFNKHSEAHNIVEQCAENINIIHEVDFENNEDYKIAHDIFRKSESIFLLGFGYDPINVNRLGLKQFHKYENIFGSTFGYTNPEIERIRLSFNCNIHLDPDGEFKAFNFLRNNDHFQQSVIS